MSESAAAQKRRRTMFWVEPGKSFNLPWVVVKRDIGVVAEYERRVDAQRDVKERNRG